MHECHLQLSQLEKCGHLLSHPHDPQLHKHKTITHITENHSNTNTPTNLNISKEFGW